MGTVFRRKTFGGTPNMWRSQISKKPRTCPEAQHPGASGIIIETTHPRNGSHGIARHEIPYIITHVDIPGRSLAIRSEKPPAEAHALHIRHGNITQSGTSQGIKYVVILFKGRIHPLPENPTVMHMSVVPPVLASIAAEFLVRAAIPYLIPAFKAHRPMSFLIIRHISSEYQVSRNIALSVVKTKSRDTVLLFPSVFFLFIACFSFCSINHNKNENKTECIKKEKDIK